MSPFRSNPGIWRVTDYDDLPSAGEYARFVGADGSESLMYRDTRPTAMAKPQQAIWVPAQLRGLTFVTAVHAETLNLADMPAGWSYAESTGTVTITGSSPDKRIQCYAGTSNGHYSKLTYTIPAPAADTDWFIVWRAEVTVAAGNQYGASLMFCYQPGTDVYAVFSPRYNSKACTYKATTGGEAGGETAEQTTERVYFSKIAYGGSADNEVRTWILDDLSKVFFANAAQVASAPGVDIVQMMAYRATTNANIKAQFIAIYTRP